MRTLTENDLEELRMTAEQGRQIFDKKYANRNLII
jgi:hypothetical protein